MESTLMRRYRWSKLTDAEKEAVNDAAFLAATRTGVGLGAVLTMAAVFSNARRGKPPLPPVLRYGSLTVFSAAGAYIGFLSGGPAYAKRILSVPNSRLADDLRVVIGDWHARAPPATPDIEPHDPLPEGPPGTARAANETQPINPDDARRLRRQEKQTAESPAPARRWTDSIGLTKA